MNIQKNKGFTLLELLVVLVIIGLLSAIGLALLGDARKKGGDAAVQANLKTISSQSGLFFEDNNNSFLPSGGAVFGIASCPAYSISGTNMLSRDKVIAGAIAEATLRGGNGNRCYNSANIWTVAVGLRTSATNSWCVDSQGASKLVSSPPSGAINGATFQCN